MALGGQEWLDAAVAGMLGMGARLAHFIREDRRALGWRFRAYELPSGFVFGLLGDGLAGWFHLTGSVQVALIVGFGFTGQRLIEMAIEKLQAWQPFRRE